MSMLGVVAVVVASATYVSVLCRVGKRANEGVDVLYGLGRGFLLRAENILVGLLAKLNESYVRLGEKLVEKADVLYKDDVGCVGRFAVFVNCVGFTLIFGITLCMLGM